MLGSCEDGSVVLHPFAERTLQTPRTVVREAERVHDVSWYPWMDAQGMRQGPIGDGFNCGGRSAGISLLSDRRQGSAGPFVGRG